MKNLLYSIIVALVFIACTEKEPLSTTNLKTGFESIIPLPLEISEGEGLFPLSSNTYIKVGESIESNSNELLSNTLEKQFSFSLQTKKKRNSSTIVLDVISDESLGDEGYLIEINEKELKITANKDAGLFYGIQSLLQMLELQNIDTNVEQINIPAVVVKDMPRFQHRGSMLDVSRHFFSIDDVKDYIDWLARYKMNVLHLHLADDQGWRIEIKSWPKLTEIGGSLEVGGTPGGFFSQSDFKEIVNYATERHIMIIPEIDMPGHTNAALASYPELNCDGKAPELYTGTQVGFSTLCINKEITYQFIDDVVKEIAAISPSPYIHIGGDEAHVTSVSDYKKFIVKVESIVEQHGKTMVGWNDIAKTNINSKSVAQYWHPFPNEINMGEIDNPVIMSPAKRAYLDMKYDESTELGLQWASLIEVDHAYNWNPEDYLPELDPTQILGIEAPLWSETVTNQDEVEYLVFPRLPGYSEIGWTKQDNRNWENYRERLALQKTYFDNESINYYPSPLVSW